MSMESDMGRAEKKLTPYTPPRPKLVHSVRGLDPRAVGDLHRQHHELKNKWEGLAGKYGQEHPGVLDLKAPFQVFMAAWQPHEVVVTVPRNEIMDFGWDHLVKQVQLAVDAWTEDLRGPVAIDDIDGNEVRRELACPTCHPEHARTASYSVRLHGWRSQ